MDFYCRERITSPLFISNQSAKVSAAVVCSLGLPVVTTTPPKLPHNVRPCCDLCPRCCRIVYLCALSRFLSTKTFPRHFPFFAFLSHRREKSAAARTNIKKATSSTENRPSSTGRHYDNVDFAVAAAASCAAKVRSLQVTPGAAPLGGK